MKALNDLYLNDAHSFGLTSVRAHCNVIAWTDNPMEVKNMRNDVGSQIAMMECKPRHNTVDAATLYWAAMPGNGADFPAEESFYTFIEQAKTFKYHIGGIILLLTSILMDHRLQ